MTTHSYRYPCPISQNGDTQIAGNAKSVSYDILYHIEVIQSWIHSFKARLPKTTDQRCLSAYKFCYPVTHPRCVIFIRSPASHMTPDSLNDCQLSVLQMLHLNFTILGPEAISVSRTGAHDRRIEQKTYGKYVSVRDGITNTFA